MGIRVAQRIGKKSILLLTNEELEALGVESEAKRGSYLLAQRMAYITGNLAFAKLRKNAGMYFIDLKGGQFIPYLWDRNCKTRRERVLKSIGGAQFENLIHAVVQPADTRIPLDVIKPTIQSFRPRLNEFAKQHPELRLIFGKFEANVSVEAEDAYLHAHLLFRSGSPTEIKRQWTNFAEKASFSKFIRIELVPQSEVFQTVNYLIKHPYYWQHGDEGFPLYAPGAFKKVSDGCLAQLDKASSNTQFIWLPRTDPYLSIRPSFPNTYDEWLSLWHDDLAKILLEKGLRFVPKEIKPRLQRHKDDTLACYKELGECFSPPQLFIGDDLSYVDWE